MKKSNKDPLDHSDSSKCSLEIILPSELEGVAYIHVEVKSVPGENLSCSDLKPGNLYVRELLDDFFTQLKKEVNALYK